MSSRPRRRVRIPTGKKYHFNILYNNAGSKLSMNDDTKLSLKVAENVVERAKEWGFDTCFYTDRDALPGRNIFDELFEVIDSSMFTIVILTKGFLANCWARYCQMSAFKSLLDRQDYGSTNRLIPVMVGINERELVQTLHLNRHVSFTVKDWQTDGKEWDKVRQMMQDKTYIPGETLPHQDIHESSRRLLPVQETQVPEIGTRLAQPVGDMPSLMQFNRVPSSPETDGGSSRSTSDLRLVPPLDQRPVPASDPRPAPVSSRPSTSSSDPRLAPPSYQRPVPVSSRPSRSSSSTEISQPTSAAYTRLPEQPFVSSPTIASRNITMTTVSSQSQRVSLQRPPSQEVRLSPRQPLPHSQEEGSSPQQSTPPSQEVRRSAGRPSPPSQEVSPPSQEGSPLSQEVLPPSQEVGSSRRQPLVPSQEVSSLHQERQNANLESRNLRNDGASSNVVPASDNSLSIILNPTTHQSEETGLKEMVNSAEESIHDQFDSGISSEDVASLDPYTAMSYKESSPASATNSSNPGQPCEKAARMPSNKDSVAGGYSGIVGAAGDVGNAEETSMEAVRSMQNQSDLETDQTSLNSQQGIPSPVLSSPESVMEKCLIKTAGTESQLIKGDHSGWTAVNGNNSDQNAVREDHSAQTSLMEVHSAQTAIKDDHSGQISIKGNHSDETENIDGSVGTNMDEIVSLSNSTVPLLEQPVSTEDTFSTTNKTHKMTLREEESISGMSAGKGRKPVTATSFKEDKAVSNGMPRTRRASVSNLARPAFHFLGNWLFKPALHVVCRADQQYI